MLVRFLSCRERFRLRYVLGLVPPDRWDHKRGYGDMWHTCEEALASGVSVEACHMYAGTYMQECCRRYPLQQDDIRKWFDVCCVQFPEYVRYWADHPDVLNRRPLMQEKVFDVHYMLPSGRTVRLRGKWDSVDLIDGGVYLQENKTKGDIDRQQVERQLRFDLQTMLYLVALRLGDNLCLINDSEVNRCVAVSGTGNLVRGVRYNVVRRPLSGGRGSIVPYKAKSTKKTYTPAETAAEFYERLRRDYIAAEPDHWFFRVRVEVSERDVRAFRETCLDPLLETVCWWYDEITNAVGHKYELPPFNYRTPFGVYSALEEGGATEYDHYLATGSEVGLRRVETLFEELQS